MARADPARFVGTVGTTHSHAAGRPRSQVEDADNARCVDTLHPARTPTQPLVANTLSLAGACALVSLATSASRCLLPGWSATAGLQNKYILASPRNVTPNRFYMSGGQFHGKAKTTKTKTSFSLHHAVRAGAVTDAVQLDVMEWSPGSPPRASGIWPPPRRPTRFNLDPDETTARRVGRRRPRRCRV